MIWDVTRLSVPTEVDSFYSSQEVIDHNQYTLGDRTFQANYCGGLRILDTSEALSQGKMTEVGFFDVSPDCDTRTFLGSWSTYPYFPSGTIVISSIDRGLFIVKYSGSSQEC